MQIRVRCWMTCGLEVAEINLAAVGSGHMPHDSRCLDPPKNASLQRDDSVTSTCNTTD
jgi:hypothetical protein